VILRLRRKLPDPDVLETIRSVGFAPRLAVAGCPGRAWHSLAMPMPSHLA
jgi:hypothetical protein